MEEEREEREEVERVTREGKSGESDKGGREVERDIFTKTELLTVVIGLVDPYDTSFVSISLFSVIFTNPLLSIRLQTIYKMDT